MAGLSPSDPVALVCAEKHSVDRPAQSCEPELVRRRITKALPALIRDRQ
ncbi:short-chain type dehydrogenase/reductase domain protein [Mycobacterium xenopi 4042]|uniref:Short-chain type dehydrogenase/reductase domain protein n=1 Tax=Mycobacterium xenopi 4042 TaxID=1299334 RepID=X8BGW5_MYCXE|nr:short-chain type dehydrogenase/reductase domain protein [Mycobacterium xenopi 4042]